MGSDTAENTKPRIYIACLAAYNSGYLHGAWIDAAQSVEAIWDEICVMLDASPCEDAEEYAIHDHEGFGDFRLEEYASIRTVADMAAFVVEHGELATIALEHVAGDVKEAREMVEERYLGCFESLADYMQDMTEDALEIPERLRFYVDWERMAKDAEIGGDLIAIERGWKEVHVFLAY